MSETQYLWSVLRTQPAITCSKLAIETPEQGVKYVQSYKAKDVDLLSLLLTLNIFDTFL